jgi:hypothetical protein
VDFHGEKHSNETHESKTDPDAFLTRKGKGKESKLSFNGSLLVDNREGLIVNAELMQANGRAERTWRKTLRGQAATIIEKKGLHD